MGCSGEVSSAASSVAHPAVGAQLVEAGEHDGERLVGAPLAPLEAAHGLAVGGVAGEVEAAEALDGEDLAAAQQLGGRADGRRRVGCAAGGHLHHLAVRRPAAAAARAARRPGRRWARRGSAGRPGPRTPAGRRGTAGSARIVVRSRS